ncbi:MAG: hypothetical protein WB799_03385 [Candidatus Sulfotelmatobacter sp.]
MMKVVAYLLIAVFVAGLAGSYFFWPGDKSQRPTAFFSLLQFIAVFAVVLLTFLYVTATQTILDATRQQLADQNREPKISVISHYFPQADPFSVNFQIEIANPSVRATSLSIKSIQIGEVTAQDVYFEGDQGRTSRITVPARDVLRVLIKAQRFNPPIPVELSRKTKTLLIFDEIFHGTLQSVITEV